MSDVKSLDHIATGIIEDRGYKLVKAFTVGPEDDVLDKHSQAMEYAENLSATTEVGYRAISKGDTFTINVYVKE